MALHWLIRAARGKKHPIIIDEGGVRLTEPVMRYVQFARIVDVRVETPLLERPRLVIMTTDEGAITWQPSSAMDLPRVCRVFEQRRDATRAVIARMAETRGDIGAWIARVSASNAMDGGGAYYRASSIDTEMLHTTLSDKADAIEARAASAHALLSRGRVELVKPLISRQSPPLVIAAVRLAKKGEDIVSPELLEEIVPFLALRDRVVFSQRQRLRA